LKKTHPDARIALKFSTPLELLVALILSARTRDEVVNAVTPLLFRRYQTAADWANEKPEVLYKFLRPVNFFRTKIRAIQRACRILVNKFGGQVPDRLEDLLTLPGVGRKTANALLGNAFGQPTITVDTHVARVSQRLGLTQHTNPEEIEADLVELVPRKEQVKFSHLLQFHGRRVCLARLPDCPHCSINDLCFYPKKTKFKPQDQLKRR
ncbi:MAG TPA: endonuclease III, partial [Candidatus Udaeobacter sp.]|nr:endonuclease III [Candidatus Udaeobacter sp.]